MKMTQKARIKRFMEENGSITAAEAMQEFGCMRLAARIDELINDGEEIHTTMVRDKNRFGEPVHYARYWMRKEHQMKLPI